MGIMDIFPLIILALFLMTDSFKKRPKEIPSKDHFNCMDEAIDYIFERMEQRGTPESKEQIKKNLDLLGSKLINSRDVLWLQYCGNYLRR